MSGLLGHIGLLLAGSGSAPGATPVWLSVTGTDFSTNVQNHPVAYPATVNSGDLLIYLLVAPTNLVGVTPPAGVTALGTANTGSTITMRAYYRIANGTEGGTTVDFATPGTNTRMTVQIHRIQAGTFNPSTPPEITIAPGLSANPDPGNLSPSWGAANTLWVISTGVIGTTTISAYPTANNNNARTGAGGTTRVLASCTDNATSSSLDPGPFTVPSSLNWGASNIAVRPV